MLPAARYLERVAAEVPGAWARVLEVPTIFWAGSTDAHLAGVAGVGLALSALVACGLTSALAMAALWVLYQSIANVGQTFYGFGWEMMLLEAGFLGIFACPLVGGPFPRRAAPAVVMVLFRWLLFRVIFGAGLIKLRGDACWRDLTCLAFHYETQPIPNPVSWYLHHAPMWFHQAGVAFNHLVELVLPWFLFWPRTARHVSGFFQALFQATLIASGNLSFLNWLTLAIAIPCFDDSFWLRLVPARWREAVARRARAEPAPPAHRGVAWLLAALVAWLSWSPVANMVSPGQVMNRSFDRFHLVNTYGAFGSIGKERHEVVIEGTAEPLPYDVAKWVEYAFRAKPGDPRRRPPIVGPYQYRLDWQIWFAAMSTYHSQPWLVHLIAKLLENDPLALGLLAGNPFPSAPPRWIRATLYAYRFTKPGEGPGWWTRTRVGEYLPPLSRDDPGLQKFLRAIGSSSAR